VKGWTLARLAQALDRREVSAVEATTQCLAWLQAVHGRLRCAIHIDPEGALVAARKSDARRKRQSARGVLDGVPLAHKDVFDRAGRRTTAGSRIRSSHVPERTADLLRRLDQAGAIDLGTLNMAEFAAGGTGHNQHWGDCANPWNPAYTPGGSSSGSACAVASGAVFGSLGTDTGGSLRWPAALCGVTTIRPTPGTVSLRGVMPRSWSLDAVGPMARSAEDCALLLEAIGGPASPRTRQRSLSNVRIGVPRGGWRADVAEEHLVALERSLRVLRRAGARIVEVTVPGPETGFALGDLVVKSEAASLHGRLLRERPEDYAPGIRAQLVSGTGILAADYLDALRLRPLLQAEFVGAAFARAEAILVPVYPFGPPIMEDCAPRSAAAVGRFWGAYPRFTRPFSYLGLPAMSVPCGFDAAGIPIAFQLAGPPGSDRRLLDIAHGFQRETDWHLRQPCVPQ